LSFQPAADPPSLLNGSVKTDLGDDDRFHRIALEFGHQLAITEPPTAPESEERFASGEVSDGKPTV
jgi:hypothetical protein